MDVTDLLHNFEQHNNIRITMELSIETTQKGPGMVITGKAWSTNPEYTEAVQLASVSVKCSAMNLKRLKDALSHVMYALDFRLAANEWDAVRTSST